MKKASYILLAMMLIIAVFVSCKAEVIDDSDYLINVMFSSENNSKGLTWSRDFAPENYYWSYDASKADNGPRTGTAKKANVGGENGQGLKHDVGPFSIGTWDFTLYGYRDGGRTELVYEGHAQAVLAKGSSNPVKVNVSSKDEQTGTILVSKDIRLTDGTNASYDPTHFSIKNAKDSSPAMDTNNSSLQNLDFSTTEDMSYTVKSGSYVVTIEMRNEDDSVVYSSTQIYINVYDYQTTRIGGSLDDVKVSTKFEADDGTITGTSGVQAISATGSTTLTVKNVTPINSGDTTVEFPQGSLGSNVKKATLEVVAYPTYAIPEKFGISGNNSPLAGIDLSVFVGGNEVTEFESVVTVTTFVTKNLTQNKITSETAIADREGFNLFYNGSEAEDMQPTLVSYNPENGELIFKTNHFSLFYVTTSSTSVVAINGTTGVAYKSLKAAVDDVAGSGYITLLQDVKDGDGILIPAGNRSITVDFNDKLYVVTKNFAEKKYQENRAFKLGKGNAVTFKNGRISSTSKWAVLIENFANLTLYDIVLDGSEIFATSSLLCKYGITQIGGLTKIINTENGSYNNTAISVNYLPDDTNYNEGELSVSFTGDYCGEVVGSIYFQSKLVRPLKMVDYTHSLKIDSKLGSSFEKANLVLQNIRSKSFFKMKENLISKEKINTSIKLVDDGEGFKVFDQDSKGILNKTIDMIYTDDLRQAVFSAEDGDELVLLKDCVLTGYPVEINSKKITIDLNGKGIKAGPNFNGTDGMIKVDSGTLVVNDSSHSGVAGSIDATTKDSVKYAIQAVKKTTIEINGGTIKGNSAAVSKNSDAVTETNYSKVTINGGSFSSDPSEYLADGLKASPEGKLWTVSRN